MVRRPAPRSQSVDPVLRDDPGTVTWSAADDRLLSEEWPRNHPPLTAFKLARSETAVYYRARELGLRSAAESWPILKVAAWTGLSLGLLRRFALEDQPDRIEARALFAFLPETRDQRWRNGVDPFFLLELEETTAEKGKSD